LFRNLIDNGVKYGGSPPLVEVAADCDDSGSVCVTVRDNGSGIPANLRRKVFGRFVRLGSELERSRPGTGLGLYLVRNITHALGGRINVSDAQQMDEQKPGTLFEVRLPGGRRIDDAPFEETDPPGASGPQADADSGESASLMKPPAAEAPLQAVQGHSSPSGAGQHR